MKLIGERIFARDAEGRLVSRIGTMFFRTPGLVTKKGVHALQRVMWLDELAKDGTALTPEEEEAEMAESVDLIFTETEVLIRPNPERMDLAFRADAELQKLVSKRQVRFLNTNATLVREALRARGENWRMARQPISQEDMQRLIAESRVSVGEQRIYYYNHLTGTRFLTASGCSDLLQLEADSFRRQMAEIVRSLSQRNRHGYPEVDLFPTTTPIEVKRMLQAIKVDDLDDAALKTAFERALVAWRVSLPAELRDERESNFEWRNTMCHALTRGPNDTSAEEQELIAGISPEFYRQIEWLPGARIVNGEVIFDEIYDEAARTQDPELLALCDNRVKSLIFNMTRLCGKIRSVNVGRIANSLSRRPTAGRRGHNYLMQYVEEGHDEPHVTMIRLQKWGVMEHLDEGKDLLRSIFEADEYSDYVLDRRLMCRQLGMDLPERIEFGRFIEKYTGVNTQYIGVGVRTAYFVRNYVHGVASDKVPLAKYRNPAWAQRFAVLMGEAAALDLAVGRRSSETNELLFDQNYEVVRMGADGLPREIKITDHAGSFVDYARPLAEMVADYAAFARRRAKYVKDFSSFAAAYVEGFSRRLSEVQNAYLSNRRAFDNLFADRPFDANGSGAYRWVRALSRLAEADVPALAERLKQAIGC